MQEGLRRRTRHLYIEDAYIDDARGARTPSGCSSYAPELLSGATGELRSIPVRVAYWRRRSGIYLNRARRSVWFHGDTVGDFESMAELVRRLRREVATDRFVFTSLRAETCEWLRRRYPNDNAIPVPFDFGPLFGRFLHQLHPSVLLWIHGAPGLSPRALDRIRTQRIAVVTVVAPNRHRPAGAEAVDQIDPSSADGLEVVLSQVPRLSLPDPTAPRRMARIAETPPGRWLIAARDRGPLADWAALRDRLGSPRSILCLGNGPSSEDPRLEQVVYDALLRVNWRWRSRGLHDRPDMVFVGDLRTTRELRCCVFGFRDIAWEREILLRHLLFGVNLDALEYFTIERVPCFLNDRRWPAHPTNGAVMIATAAGLEPERLTIAGIDLYRDPRRRYPWDRMADNDLPQMHSARVEAEVIGRALDDYPGEVVILSEPLQRALEQRRHELSPGPGPA